MIGSLLRSGMMGSRPQPHNLSGLDIEALARATGTGAMRPPPTARGMMGARRPLPMPGPVSGYGGGTFNLDGSQATPVQPSNDLQRTPADGLLGTTMTPIRRGQPQGQPMQSPPAPQGPLGGSMRQPFDYDAALARLMGEKPKIKDWQKVAAVLGDALIANGGGQPYAMRSLMDRQSEYSDRERNALETLLGWQHQDWSRQNEADLQAANPFTIGRDRISYDPATGTTQTIYDGPEDFELYASELGLEPGSDEYFQAVEDFVLRSSGPSAHERDVGLEGVRQGNRAAMETQRQSNRSALERQRQTNRQGMEGTRQTNRREMLPLARTPEEAMALPAGTKFRTLDGRILVVPRNPRNTTGRR